MAGRAGAFVGDDDFLIVIKGDDFDASGVELDVRTDFFVDDFLDDFSFLLGGEVGPARDPARDFGEVVFDGSDVVVRGKGNIEALVDGPVDGGDRLVEVGKGLFGKDRLIFSVPDVLVDEVGAQTRSLVIIFSEDQFADDFAGGDEGGRAKGLKFRVSDDPVRLIDEPIEA